MTATPAERRAIVRGAIECAIRLAPGTRDRQTGPLTTTVWRVIEPALAQRDAQLDAVRDVVAAMGETTGARFWAEQLHAALRPQPPAAATPQPPLTWCAASMPGVGGEPIGPCVLRAGHDGPVHQAATGARWWTAAEPDPAPLRRLAEQALGDPEPGSIRRDPRADDPAYDGITGYRTWAEVEADPPQFTGILQHLADHQEQQP